MLKFFNAKEDLKKLVDELDARRQEDNKDINETVSNILKDVRANGDKALKEYTEKFDKVKLDNLQVTEKELEDILSCCSAWVATVIVRKD